MGMNVLHQAEISSREEDFRDLLSAQDKRRVANRQPTNCPALISTKPYSCHLWFRSHFSRATC
jgi:hypothetical protein